ncbi:hypothetical protein MEP401_gp56 [Methylophilales phage MEP401]|nr:hypothetical protein MEP401_gp56 [Methylophilales phage MEP401]
MSTIINADTSGGLKLTSDTSGEIKLQSAGADIATVNSSGIAMASGKTLINNAPVFRAQLISSQTISANTSTKVAFNNAVYDTNSNYNTSTYRFTPTVAGYYNVGAKCRMASAGGNTTLQQLYLYKNGSLHNTMMLLDTTLTTYNELHGADIIYLNGTTDYIELYAYIGNSGGTPTIVGGGGGNTSFWYAYLIQQA